MRNLTLIYCSLSDFYRIQIPTKSHVCLTGQDNWPNLRTVILRYVFFGTLRRHIRVFFFSEGYFVSAASPHQNTYQISAKLNRRAAEVYKRYNKVSITILPLLCFLQSTSTFCYRFEVYLEVFFDLKASLVVSPSALCVPKTNISQSDSCF